VDYATLAEWRYQLRRLIGRRETAARTAGVEPQQYVLLLQIKGLEARGAVTIGMLAERLQIRHHSAVELVDRLVKRGRRPPAGGRDSQAGRRDGSSPPGPLLTRRIANGGAGATGHTAAARP